MAETQTGRPEAATIAAFLITAFFAGANPVAIKLGYTELAPFWGAAIRFLAAALILVAAMILMRLALPRGRAMLGALIYGVLNFGLSYTFAYWALTEASAGMAMVVLAIVPLLTLILAVLQGIEQFHRWALIGAIVAALGVGIIFKDSIGTVSVGALTALVAGALCVAEVNIVIKKFPQVNPIVENAIGMLVGGAMLLALSLAIGEPRTIPSEPVTLLSLAYLILLGTIGLFLLYLHVIRRWTATATAYILIIAPLFSIILGFLVLDEPVSATFLFGCALVVLGVYLGAFLRTKAPQPAE